MPEGFTDERWNNLSYELRNTAISLIHGSGFSMPFSVFSEMMTDMEGGSIDMIARMNALRDLDVVEFGCASDGGTPRIVDGEGFLVEDADISKIRVRLKRDFCVYLADKILKDVVSDEDRKRIFDGYDVLTIPVTDRTDEISFYC